MNHILPQHLQDLPRLRQIRVIPLQTIDLYHAPLVSSHVIRYQGVLNVLSLLEDLGPVLVIKAICHLTLRPGLPPLVRLLVGYLGLPLRQTILRACPHALQAPNINVTEVTAVKTMILADQRKERRTKRSTRRRKCLNDTSIIR
jgi:hypothetical protein